MQKIVLSCHFSIQAEFLPVRKRLNIYGLWKSEMCYWWLFRSTAVDMFYSITFINGFTVTWSTTRGLFYHRMPFVYIAIHFRFVRRTQEVRIRKIRNFKMADKCVLDASQCWEIHCLTKRLTESSEPLIHAHERLSFQLNWHEDQRRREKKVYCFRKQGEIMAE